MSKRRAINAGCPDCVEGLDHCHSTLIEHADGAWSCADDDCDLGPASHGSWAPCQDVGQDVDRGCGCGQRPAAQAGPQAA